MGKLKGNVGVESEKESKVREKSSACKQCFLFCVWLLTHLFENAFVEELLQFLIAVIDAELFKAVVLKVF